jgi:diaminopropionate ammonia-lyase
VSFLVNPLRDPSWRPEPGLEADARAFHESLPDYAPTALHELEPVAAELGVGRLLLKDESARFGLPAFKALGAFWAAHWALRGRDPSELTLVAATEGNHGRAVARAARLLGARAHIVIPRHTAPSRAEARASRPSGQARQADDHGQLSLRCSRRPSAAAGCARLASLAVLAGQHRATSTRTSTSSAPAQTTGSLR